MKKLVALLCFWPLSLWARSAETIYFRAVMLPSNEVPPIDIDASRRRHHSRPRGARR